ncbi:MAG: hypothetical protein H7333_02920 [Bdellovibrionales bacterium]|nr:hypothetical protein [Oligoflexia bacterium]
MKCSLSGISIAACLILATGISKASAAELESIFVPYGFLTASYWTADHSVVSVGTLNSNFSAPVASGLDRGQDDRQNLRVRGAFEVQQSRFGFQIFPKSVVHGKFEFDFLNSANAAPATASQLRLRIAKIEWQLSESSMLFIGQDWDLFGAGVNPHTHNWVGNEFQGGNVGFMRQQLGILTRSEHMEYGFALGMAQNSASNLGAFPSSNSDTDFSVPTFALKVALLSDKSKYGVTGIYAPRISAAQIGGLDTSNSHTAFGTLLFADAAAGDDFTIHAKLYWGQNLKDIGTLALSAIVPGSGTANSRNLHEFGGFISVAHSFSKLWNAYGGFGYAKISEESALPTEGLIRNWQTKLGGDYLIPDSKAKVFLELTRYATQYKFAADNTGFAAYASQLGIEMPF